MRSMMLAGAMALATLAACSKEQASDSLLAYVPADTPYAIVSAEPLDPALRRAWLEKFGGRQILDAAGRFMDLAEKNAKDDEARQDLAIARKLLAELGPMLDPAVSSPLGLAARQEMAFYGHGLLPVLRMRLDDPAAFEASVARIEASVGKTMDRAEVGGKTVRRQVLEDVVLYLAVIDNQAVLALTPSSADEQVREAALGLSRPAQSLAQTSTIADLVSRYQLAPMAGVGYIDSQRLLSSLLAPEHPGDKALLEAIESGEEDEGQTPTDSSDDTCKAEARLLAEQFPRIVIGGTRFDANALDTLTVIELKPEWASQWAAVASPQAGGSTPKDALVWFGFGLDPIKTGTLLGKIADKTRTEPWQCAELAGLNEAMGKLKESLNPMVIGMSANFHGVFLSLDSIEFDDNREPSGATGVLALSSPQPAAVWSFAQAQVEALAGIDLQPGGPLVDVPEDLVPLPLPARALMTERSIAVSLGDADQARIQAVAAVSTTGPHPVLRYGESGRFYSEFYAQVFEQAMAEGMLGKDDEDEDFEDWADDEADGQDDADAADETDGEDGREPPLSEEDARAIAAEVTGFMKRFGEALEYTEMRMILTDRGIELQQDMRLK